MGVCDPSTPQTDPFQFRFRLCEAQRKHLVSGDPPLQSIPSILQFIPKPLQNVPYALQGVPNHLQSAWGCVMINLSIGNKT